MVEHLRDALYDISRQLDAMEREIDQHECGKDASREQISEAYDEGQRDLRKELLEKIETRERQAAVGLVKETMTLAEVKEMVKWAGSA